MRNFYISALEAFTEVEKFILELQNEEKIKIKEIPVKKSSADILLLIFFLMVTLLPQATIVDYIVGEKEKKTIYTLLSAPVSKREVVYAKNIASFLIGAFQCLLWMPIVILSNIEIKNIFIVVPLLISLSFLIVSISSLVATGVDTIKEASQYIVVLTMAIPFFFASSFVTNPSGNSYNPVSLLIVASLGRDVAINKVFFDIIVLFILSFIFLELSVKRLRGDNI